MMQSVRCLLPALVLLVGLTATAAPPDPKAAQAKELYESGLAHFNLQEYKQAIDDFSACYRVKPNPTLLYNIAQANRLSDNLERALYFYQTYLRSVPNAPNRAEVEQRIASLEKLIKVHTSVTTAPPDRALGLPTDSTGAPTPTAPPPSESPHVVEVAPPVKAAVAVPVAVEPSTPPAENTPVYKKWWLWTIVGVVVVAGVGVGLGVGLSKPSGFSSSIPDVGPGAHMMSLSVSL